MNKPKLLNIKRFEIINKLNGNQNIGVELGVAEGNFSKKLIKSNKFSFFYGIDSYNNFQHNDKEYKITKSSLSKFKNYKLIRKTFNNAIDLFKDEYFDFIYIDGFAHTGNNGGETLFNWFNKLKIGGILAGDDYHKDWPLVIDVVNEFIRQTNFQLFLTEKSGEDHYSQYPSWFIFKEKKIDLFLPEIYKIKSREQHKKEIIRRKNKIIRFSLKLFLYKFLKKILPNKLFIFLLNIYKKIF
ncbi:MAG: hypothetical protein CMA27_01140 [Euryarchaeota archaeon]|nr:hypothetical protein [Euryarchaeota archaeon]